MENNVTVGGGTTAASGEFTQLDVCTCSSVTFQSVAPPTPLLEDLSEPLNQVLKEANSQQTSFMANISVVGCSGVCMVKRRVLSLRNGLMQVNPPSHWRGVA